MHAEQRGRARRERGDESRERRGKEKKSVEEGKDKTGVGCRAWEPLAPALIASSRHLLRPSRLNVRSKTPSIDLAAAAASSGLLGFWSTGADLHDVLILLLKLILSVDVVLEDFADQELHGLVDVDVFLGRGLLPSGEAVLLAVLVHLGRISRETFLGQIALHIEVLHY